MLEMIGGEECVPEIEQTRNGEQVPRAADVWPRQDILIIHKK